MNKSPLMATGGLEKLVPCIVFLLSVAKIDMKGEVTNFVPSINLKTKHCRLMCVSVSATLHDCVVFYCVNSHNGRVYHYRIWQSQSNELYIDDVIRFQSLEEMIEFYKTQGG